MCFSLALFPRTPLWTYMTDRGSPSSVAPGPPSRRSLVSLHSGRPASPSERTLHRNDPVLFLPAVFLYIYISQHPPPFSLLKTPWPLRDNLQTLTDLFKDFSQKTPLSSALHVKTDTNQNKWEKQMRSPYRAKDALKRGSLDVITPS